MNSQIVRYKRSILTALLALLASAVVAHANDFAVQGSLAGHGIGVVEGGTLRATASGAGTASHIGLFTYALNATVDLATGNGGGVFLLVFSTGDVIYGSFVRQPTATPNVAEIIEHLTIIGGTGRFKGATGSLTIDRFVDLTTLPAFESHSGTLTGTSSTPGSAK